MSDPTNGEALRFATDLPAHPVSVAVARNFVRGLRSCLDEEQLHRLELIMSEAVTNAIRYGSPQPGDRVDVELVVTPASVSGSVHDRGPAFSPPTGVPRTDQIGGFGLHIIGQLAATWALERSELGNQVTFTL
ncbi:MAG: ATP-binding protein [Frankiales bacterium]|jgi:anti-sigma regulatory factor (Ser/Thr protein kinase)|nr:ATP-binding protein [Frankiales bacterium]